MSERESFDRAADNDNDDDGFPRQKAAQDGDRDGERQRERQRQRRNEFFVVLRRFSCFSSASFLSREMKFSSFQVFKFQVAQSRLKPKNPLFGQRGCREREIARALL